MVPGEKLYWTLNGDVQNGSGGSLESSANENIEEKLENILANVKGIGKVKVMITYSQTNEVIPMYDEDSSSSTTEEKDSGGGTRTVNENSSKKDIIYKEEDGVKTPITQSVVKPKIEGAIIVAEGASDATVKTNIVQAVEAVTGVATYKIQVLEMKWKMCKWIYQGTIWKTIEKQVRIFNKKLAGGIGKWKKFLRRIKLWFL